MMKLGYTFYPKDWQTDDAIFELSLEERGLFRELIDLAMLNDNKTTINHSVWCRKFNIEEADSLTAILERLRELKLIEVKEDTLFIPSCEKRLKLVRGGRKGGKKKTSKKPTTKPADKPIVKPFDNQNEIEIKIENKELLKNCLDNKNWLNLVSKNNKLKVDKLKAHLVNFESDLRQKDDEKGNMKEFKNHFINWLKKQPSSEWRPPNYF